MIQIKIIDSFGGHEDIQDKTNQFLKNMKNIKVIDIKFNTSVAHNNRASVIMIMYEQN